MNISKYLSCITNTAPKISQHIALAIFILPLLFAAEGNAAIYKWVDADGNVHYAQQRPNDADAEKLDIQQEPSTTYHSGEKEPVKPEEAAQNGEQEQEPAAEAPEEEEKKPETAAEKKQRLEACAKARKALATMESIGRIRSKDAEGNYSYLSQQQKEAQMQQARDLIKKYCY